MKYKKENCPLRALVFVLPSTSIIIQLRTHPIKQPSPDLGALGVQSDGNAGIHSVLFFVHLVGNPHVVDGFSMILMRSRKGKALTTRATFILSVF